MLENLSFFRRKAVLLRRRPNSHENLKDVCTATCDIDQVISLMYTRTGFVMRLCIWLDRPPSAPSSRWVRLMLFRTSLNRDPTSFTLIASIECQSTILLLLSNGVGEMLSGREWIYCPGHNIRGRKGRSCIGDNTIVQSVSEGV